MMLDSLKFKLNLIPLLCGPKNGRRGSIVVSAVVCILLIIGGWLLIRNLDIHWCGQTQARTQFNATFSPESSRATQGQTDAKTHSKHSMGIGFLLFVGIFTLIVYATLEILRGSTNKSFISELRQTRIELSAKTEFLRAVFESIPNPIFYKDKEGAYLGCNKAFELAMGESADEIVGKTVYDVAPSDLASVYHQADLDMLAEGCCQVYETEMEYAEGRRHSVVVSEAPFRAADGSVAGLVGTMTDISDRKHAEDLLRKSEERFRSLVQNSSDVIFVAQANGTVSYVSPSVTNVLGLQPEKFLSQRRFELVHPEDSDMMMDKFAEMVQRPEGAVEFCCRLAKADGSWAYVEGIGHNLLNDEAVNGIVINLRDVTARLEAQDRLKEAEMRYRMLFDASPDGILLVDPGTALPILYNDAVCSMLGYSREEFASLRVSDYEAVQTKHTLKHRFKRILKLGRDDFETRHRRKDGELVDVFITVQTLDLNGKTVLNAIFRNITEHKSYVRQLDHLTHYDPPTGLPNRLLFRDKLDDSVKRGNGKKKSAVVFVDLDRFKSINDTLGHDVGDLLLQKVADRLRSCVRSVDTLARMGGDEFAILLNDVRSEEDVSAVAERIMESLNCAIPVAGHELVISASIGYSISPQDGTDSDTLLMNADAAMYKAKENGRNRYQAYSKDMNIVALESLKTENHLRKAVEREEFVLFYQPKIDLFTGSVTGSEALLRWIHPENGFTAPSSFIPIAEETGLIVPIGEWVLRAACAQTRAWHDQGLTDLHVSVNVSPRQFQSDESLVSVVKTILAETGLPPHSLEIEITESTLMQNAEHAVETLHLLKQMGLKLSIDDFGTGYSSLSYLKRFPIDSIKIDRSFVRDVTTNLEDASICGAIVAMAHTLCVKVVAEGVETKEQWHYLKTLGCDEVQGFLVSKPVPVPDFEHFVANWQGECPEKMAA